MDNNFKSRKTVSNRGKCNIVYRLLGVYTVSLRTEVRDETALFKSPDKKESFYVVNAYTSSCIKLETILANSILLAYKWNKWLKVN